MSADDAATTANMITRPMLAATASREDLTRLDWDRGMMCSPKIDGIRCIIHPVLGPVTRSFKAIPNVHTYDALVGLTESYPYLDGELVVVNDDGEVLSFNETQSAIMTRGGQPLFRYLVFDSHQNPKDRFIHRSNDAFEWIEYYQQCARRGPAPPVIEHVPQTLIIQEEDFITFHDKCISEGYEGSMLRHIDSPYKSGRSTLPQQWLIKYKNWADAEGIVVGFEELQHNDNPDTKDTFGLAKRSSHLANKRAGATLGALILNTQWGTLRVGSGFSAAQREDIWEHNMDSEVMYREKQTGPRDVGRTVTFKYQAFGMQEKPRFPIFLRFRDPE